MWIIYRRQFLLRLIAEAFDKGCAIDMKYAGYKFPGHAAGR